MTGAGEPTDPVPAEPSWAPRVRPGQRPSEGKPLRADHPLAREAEAAFTEEGAGLSAEDLAAALRGQGELDAWAWGAAEDALRQPPAATEILRFAFFRIRLLPDGWSSCSRSPCKIHAGLRPMIDPGETFEFSVFWIVANLAPAFFGDVSAWVSFGRLMAALRECTAIEVWGAASEGAKWEPISKGPRAKDARRGAPAKTLGAPERKTLAEVDQLRAKGWTKTAAAKRVGYDYRTIAAWQKRRDAESTDK